jgi:hypothetical protein
MEKTHPRRNTRKNSKHHQGELVEASDFSWKGAIAHHASMKNMHMS